MEISQKYSVYMSIVSDTEIKFTYVATYNIVVHMVTAYLHYNCVSANSYM